MDLTNQLAVALVSVLLSGVMGAIISLAPKAAGYLKHKADAIKNEDLRNAVKATIDHLENTTVTIVASMKQTIVDPAKEGQKWDNALGKETLANAKGIILNQLTAEQKILLSSKFGNLDTYIEHLIESAVLAHSQTGNQPPAANGSGKNGNVPPSLPAGPRTKAAGNIPPLVFSTPRA